LTAAGVMTTFSPEPEQALIMDLGGRSAEFIIRRNARNEKTVSLPLGVVALTETFLISDPPGEDEMKTLSGEVADVLKDRLSPDFIEAGWNLMIGTAGTATTLAAVAQGLTGYNPELINGYVLKSADIECMFANFIRVSRAERARTPGLPEDRADIIIAGIGVIMETMKFININRLTVSDAGLLEGIWLVAAGLKECHHA